MAFVRLLFPFHTLILFHIEHNATIKKLLCYCGTVMSKNYKKETQILMI